MLRNESDKKENDRIETGDSTNLIFTELKISADSNTFRRGGPPSKPPTFCQPVILDASNKIKVDANNRPYIGKSLKDQLTSSKNQDPTPSIEQLADDAKKKNGVFNL